MEKAPQGNLIVSPLSVSIALAMAYNGARGATAEEIANSIWCAMGLEVEPDFPALDRNTFAA